MPSDNTNERRRIILVDRRYQLRDLGMWTITALTFILVSVFFYFFLQRFYNYQPDKNVIKLMVGTLIFILLFAILMGLNSILRGHRVAGAAYRIETCVKRALGGDYQFSVTLREGDYLVNVARVVNQLLVDLLERRHHSEEARAVLEELLASGKLPPAESEKVKAVLERLNSALQKT